MAKFENPLNNIRVASPCPANWNEMMGDERKRYCGECKLNVYNLSGMTRREAEDMIINSEGRLCVRFYRRSDGTVLTKDCPVGWQAIKRRVSKIASAYASLVFALLSGIGLTAYFNQPKTGANVLGEMAVDFKHETTGKIAVEPDEAVMGDIAEENLPIVGMMVKPIEEKQQNKKNRKNK